MEIRAGTEEDLDAIAGLTGTAAETARGFLRDRIVRVCADGGDVIALLCYYYDGSRLHITRLTGDPAGFEPLLRDPIEVAESEGRPIETVIPDSNLAVREVLDDAGFAPAEPGPRFDDESTTWYLREPDG